tara:strand:- start:739 stop:2622 length:1884 start_codon:yes stop_codon:yes gene_type:complete
MIKTKNPKTIVVTIPLRATGLAYPPVGGLSVVTVLRRAGFTNSHLYNIDWFRPTFNQAIDHLKKEQPDILGISAVVSTSYEYTKKLSLKVKEVLPQTTIILGGNMGASAEIVLKKTAVDFICTGEGDRTAVEFVKCWQTGKNKSAFANIKGLAFLDENKNLITTPYPDPIEAKDVYDIDWSLLDETGEMEIYLKELGPVMRESSFFSDPRNKEPHRKDKTCISIVASKGCVARCTFCHRWDKGIRYIPVSVVMERIDFFIEKYNAGFIAFGDENFGTDKRWLGEFIAEIKKRDVVWRVGGMRVNCITPEWLAKMKDAGCAAIIMGMESGSQRMLDVMEKKTTVEQNENAIKWMAENYIYTVVQLVIAMPGETPETIHETSNFTSSFVELDPKIDPNFMSINYAQALPGTPLYEVARRKGLIGQSLDDEEEYLIKISGRDARDGETFINLTGFPRLVVENWYFEICTRTRMAYIKKWGKDRYLNSLLRSPRFKNLKEAETHIKDNDLGYFAGPARGRENFSGKECPSPWSLLRQNSISSASSFYPQFFWSLRYFSIFFTLLNCVRKYGTPSSVKILWKYIKWKTFRSFSSDKNKKPMEYISLRKQVDKNIIPDISTDNPAMALLRKGR